MKGKDFINSKWVEQGATANGQNFVKDNFNKWTTRVSNTGLLARAKQLYQFFLSPDITGMQKTFVAGALLYVISPLDIIPDFFPVIGWLDDLGIASFALSYIFSQMNKVEFPPITRGQEVSNCSYEELLDKEISGTSVECEWNLRSCLANTVPAGNYQSTEIKNKLAEITEITDTLSVDGADAFLNRIETKMEENRIMSVAVVGRYSTGKSTLINALLEKEILPSSPVPTTKAVTYVMKGNAESLYSEGADGEIVIYDSLRNLLSQYDKDISSAKKITITLPDFPFDNLSFIDTPGLEEPDQSIAQLTLNAIPDADAIVVVLDANYLQSKVEFQFISSLLENDKGRKLFVVINKVDGKSESQIRDLENMCRSLLIEYGIPDAGIYSISAKKSESTPGFTKFKKSLFDFLLNGIQAEVYKHLNNELSSYASLLKDSCENRLELAAKNDRDRNLAIAENRKRAASITNEYEKQKRSVSIKFKQYQAQFFLDFSNFIDSLKASAQQEINASSLEKLKNTEILAKKIKQEIVAFVDANIAIINEKLSVDISDSQMKIKTHLAQMQVQIDGEIKDYSAYAGLFMPAVVLVSFLSCGFLTFIWTVIAAMIGRNFFESAIASFLSSVGIKGMKEKLMAQVSSNIDKIKQELIIQLESSFSAIEEDLSHSFDQAGRNATASFVGIIEDESVSRNSIIDCRERLQNLII